MSILIDFMSILIYNSMREAARNNILRRKDMKKRNIALAIVFTIVTLGIYGIYWYVCLTNDSNRLNPQEKTASGGVAILFTILTLGIYDLYWHYKLGKKLNDSGAVYLILSLLGLGIIARAIAQSKINAAV